MSRLVALLMLVWSASKGAAGAEFLLWHTTGKWNYKGEEAKRFAKVDKLDELIPAEGAGKAVLLRDGTYTVRTCASPKSCTNEENKPLDTSGNRQPVGQAGFWDRLTAASDSLSGVPAFQLPVSRAAGWKDAVVVKGADGSIDLKDVFSAARIRVMNFELCSIKNDGCAKGLSADWDGSSARLKGQQGLALGTYRLIASNGSNEAWIRVVEPSDYERVAKAYEQALTIIRTWSLPAEIDGAPSFDRLERLALAGLGHGQ